MLPEPLSLLKGWGRRRVHERRKTKSSDSRSRLAAPIGSPHPLLRPDKKPYSQRTPARLPLFMLHTVLPTLWHRPWDCCLGGSSRMLALCCRFPVFAHSIPRRTESSHVCCVNTSWSPAMEIAKDMRLHPLAAQGPGVQPLPGRIRVSKLMDISSPTYNPCMCPQECQVR